MGKIGVEKLLSEFIIVYHRSLSFLGDRKGGRGVKSYFMKIAQPNSKA